MDMVAMPVMEMVVVVINIQEIRTTKTVTATGWDPDTETIQNMVTEDAINLQEMNMTTIVMAAIGELEAIMVGTAPVGILKINI